MPAKPNYNHQRAERDRAKKASKALKLQERKDQAALRKTGAQDGTAPNDDTSPESEQESGKEPGREPGE